MTEAMTAKEYVKLCLSLAEKNGMKSPYSLLMEHGEEYTWTGWSLPRGVRRGQSGLCFMNAYHLALEQPDKYRYVEGIAQHFIPTAHAWCITAEGVVVDPTWRRYKGDDTAVPQYFGVAIKVEYVMKAILKSGVYGVLFDYLGKYPMLRAKPEEWRTR